MFGQFTLTTPTREKHELAISKFQGFRLTPILEDFNDLRLGSSDKKTKDDFSIFGISDPIDLNSGVIATTVR